MQTDQSLLCQIMTTVKLQLLDVTFTRRVGYSLLPKHTLLWRTPDGERPTAIASWLPEENEGIWWFMWYTVQELSILTRTWVLKMKERSASRAKWTALNSNTLIWSPFQGCFHMTLTDLPFQTASQSIRETSIHTTVLRDGMFPKGDSVS